jgi:hypothetical protein
MLAVEVCELPETGGSTLVVIFGLFMLIAGVIVTRWVQTSAGRLSVVVAPLVLLGGLVVIPSSTDPCSSTTTIVPPTTTTTTTTTSTTTTTTTTTTIALTCVTGGSCVVGDTGPGGGIVFYVDLNAPSGSRYLEAACHGWSNNCDGTTADPIAEWGCKTQTIAGADGLDIGTGEQNTVDIVAGCPTAGIAARLADDLVLGGQIDWFLPSYYEINELCKYARNTGQAAGIATQCAGGTLRAGFSADRYWTSTERDITRAWFKNMDNGNYNVNDKDYALYPVRPVRAF